MKHPPEVERARRLRQTQSVAEKLLWEKLRRNQLKGWGFRRQAPLGGFVVDFLCHKPALVIEIDGPMHQDEEQKVFDAARTEKLERLGYLVVRVMSRLCATMWRMCWSGFPKSGAWCWRRSLCTLSCGH